MLGTINAGWIVDMREGDCVVRVDIVSLVWVHRTFLIHPCLFSCYNLCFSVRVCVSARPVSTPVLRGTNVDLNQVLLVTHY